MVQLIGKLNKIMKNNKKTAFTVVELSIVLLVMALVIGMTLGGNAILRTAKLTNLRSISAKSPIYDIPDNTFWLDVTAKDAFDSYPQNDDSISSMYDVSPNLENNINLTQGTGSSQPTFVYDSVDGLPYLSFDGGDSLVDTQSRSVVDFSGVNQATIILVLRNITGANIIFNFRDGSNNRLSTHCPFGSTMYFDFGICCSAANRTSVATPSDFSNNWKIVSLVKYSASGIIRVDGATIATNSSMSGSHTLPSTDDISIGDDFNGNLREVLTFKRGLNSDEIEDIERYLAHKWQIDLD